MQPIDPIDFVLVQLKFHLQPAERVFTHILLPSRTYSDGRLTRVNGVPLPGLKWKYK